MRNEVDSRISTLMENCMKLRQRGFFVIVGDRGKEQVANMYYHLTRNMNFLSKPAVLWCYKRELGFSNYKPKRAKEAAARKELNGNSSASEVPVVVDTFQHFLAQADIHYCFYKDSQKVLGQTNQMLILQDFEAFTPNMLCRTIETVEGGGFIFLLFKTMASLKTLYTLKMDVHNRFRTDQFNEIDPRFNERFILSFSRSENTIVMDDELNILPISSLIDKIKPVTTEESSLISIVSTELKELIESQKSDPLVGPLVSLAKTVDQAKAIITLIEGIKEQTKARSTISLTAGRGRGKSATIGIAIAAAVCSGFSNICVTAPTPESLKTVFEFVFAGLESQNYIANTHYSSSQSTNPEFNNAVIRVNIFKTHKQVIQYIAPTDFPSIGHADLVVIDEAAAIPLTFVKQFLGPYKVFLSSTINGYEGTGRSLSIKLIEQLRAKNKIGTSNGSEKDSHKQQQGSRTLKELTLNDPIRYSLNDPIEAWLNGLLCLEATKAVTLKHELPSPNDCELLMVNKDTLFSYKKQTESFLFNLMSLFISSHYKNSPNDLQLLSETPSHAIFVLMGCVKPGEKKFDMPDILCAVQVALEGKISQETFNSSAERGIKPSGDLIPWTISEQFHDRNFQSLAGARVVRIATHPEAVKMGYGSKALELLGKFFEGQFLVSDPLIQNPIVRESYQLVSPRNAAGEKKLKPLLKRLNEIEPPCLDYLGVAFGLSKELFKFWKKSGYSPLYLRQIKNELTAEHSCIMVRELKKQKESGKDQLESNWLESYVQDFKKRFLSLLSNEFRNIDVQLCLGVIDPSFIIDEREAAENVANAVNTSNDGTQNLRVFKRKEQLDTFISDYDLTRLEAYTKKNIALNLIIDLLCDVSKQLFQNRFNVQLTLAQCAIFLGLGLQHKSIENLAKELFMPVNSIFGIFNKGMKKVTAFLASLTDCDTQMELESNLSNQQFDCTKVPNKEGLINHEFNSKRPATTLNHPDEMNETEGEIDPNILTKKFKSN